MDEVKIGTEEKIEEEQREAAAAIEADEKNSLVDEIGELRSQLASEKLRNSALSRDIARVDDLGEKHKEKTREKNEKWSKHMHPLLKSLIAFAIGTIFGVIYFAIKG